MVETFDPHKNTVEVRQGNRKKMNLRVLVIATVVVVIAFAVLFAASQMLSGGPTAA